MPLSVPAAKLVEYYKEGRLRGPLFRHLPTDQAFNRIIKRICRRIGINKGCQREISPAHVCNTVLQKNNGDLGTLSKTVGPYANQHDDDLRPHNER